MSIYECNENQFIENVRRLAESGNKFIVNRRIEMLDDHRYGLSTLPDKEFEKYSIICYRRGYKKSAYAKVPFIDEFHRRFYNANDILHSSSNLMLARLSIPYFRVEYSFSIWGSMYIHEFDVLFKPEIRIEKRRIPRLKKSMLIHVLRFNMPSEDMLSIKLPDDVIVFDVKKLARIFDR